MFFSNQNQKPHATLFKIHNVYNKALQLIHKSGGDLSSLCFCSQLSLIVRFTKNTKKDQTWLLLFLALISFDVAAGDLSVNDIRRDYKEIRDNLSSLRQVKVELDGYSTDGGGAIGYLDSNNQIRMIRVELYGESGKVYEEYYYLNGKLFFAFYENHTYNVPYYVTPEVAKDTDGISYDPSKTEIKEDRYYFSSGKLIQWLDTNKKQKNPSSAVYIETEKSVLEFSGMVYKLVVKNLTISSTRTYLRGALIVQNLTISAPIRHAC